MAFVSDRQRKKVMASLTDSSGSSKSKSRSRVKRSGISKSKSKLPDVKVLSLPDFYDVYTVKNKTIVPAKGFYDHDKHIIYLNMGSVSKANVVQVMAHELGHHFFGKRELYAEKFAKSQFGQNLAKEFIKSKKIVV